MGCMVYGRLTLHVILPRCAAVRPSKLVLTSSRFRAPRPGLKALPRSLRSLGYGRRVAPTCALPLVACFGRLLPQTPSVGAYSASPAAPVRYAGHIRGAGNHPLCFRSRLRSSFHVVDPSDAFSSVAWKLPPRPSRGQRYARKSTDVRPPSITVHAVSGPQNLIPEPAPLLDFAPSFLARYIPDQPHSKPPGN